MKFGAFSTESPCLFLINFLKEEAQAGVRDYEESPEPCDGRDKERKGSTCKQLRPLPTFVKVESQSSVELAERTYVRKNAAELTVEEKDYNEKLYEETLATIFPEDKMKDKFYRDKVTHNNVFLIMYLKKRIDIYSRRRKLQ